MFENPGEGHGAPPALAADAHAFKCQNIIFNLFIKPILLLFCAYAILIV